MSLITILNCFLFISTSCSNKADVKPLPEKPDQTPVDKNWTFETTPIWADEFETPGQPDATKWGYDIGGSGWGNNELEYYTNTIKNAEVSNGTLKINAVKESFNGKEYTSARMVSKGKGDFLYGRFVFKAKLPAGKGTWPAIWMLPTDFSYGDWPKSGEIDIMEHVGYDPNNVHITVHTDAYNGAIGTQKGDAKAIPTATSDFHIYRLDWTPYAVRGYIDDQEIFNFINEGKGFSAWPFDKKFHILMNVAVGGNWGGKEGVDPTAFPAVMEVDYARVYKMIEK
ncbi:Beta-glucanase precursor [Arcticibacter svalbardensis MN12-7]|uniref:Beta-glucanase n=1 Tax=Arcticibacter svalbardensis MN12-7 TaxID=1150600 RepID=R9GQ27_9SPHI|nr:glycoside hydrolase family 16 protein [Arcticibacter svalbardensis]EOR93821.1 Beta-glucanase precursor [Arcticibacter svalbardensis MN12-7]